MDLGSIASSALSAFSAEMLVNANNIANVNTPGFQSQNVSLMAGPREEGVQVASIYSNTTPGPLMPVSVTRDGEHGRTEVATGYLEGSNTDIAVENIRMVATQRAFEANAAVIRTHSDITGTVLDLKI